MRASALPKIVVFALLFSGFVSSQNQQSVARFVRYEVKPEYEPEFQKALSSYVLESVSKDSNIMAEAHYEQDKPHVFWLIERWNRKKEWEKFGNSPQSKALALLVEKALVMPAEIIAVKDLHPISKREWRRTAQANESQLTIMLFVRSKSGTQQKFRDVYSIAMPQFRSETGVVTYQLSEFENDDAQFVTYEKFRNEEAFQYHLNFPPIQPVIDYLKADIKNPPFQDSVHRLIEFAPLIREN